MVLMKKMIVVIALLLGIVLISGCAGQQVTTTQPEQAQTGEVKEFTITAFSFGYSPSAINVNEGDTVRITITSQDTAHTFTISELGVNEQLPAGQTRTIEFVASKKGTFAFYCAVPGHRAGGMEGHIIVS